MLWKLNRKKYKDVYVTLEQLEVKATYANKINIYVDYFDKFYSGTAFSKSTILLSRKLVKLYDDEQEIPLKSILAHEFAHLINGDSIKQMKSDRKHDIHTVRLINIIKEIRAEIVGANLIGFLPNEINEAQNILMEKNEGTKNIKVAYEARYPTRIQIKYFAKRYSNLTKNVIYYFISSYFRHMDIKDKTRQEEIKVKVEARFL